MKFYYINRIDRLIEVSRSLWKSLSLISTLWKWSRKYSAFATPFLPSYMLKKEIWVSFNIDLFKLVITQILSSLLVLNDPGWEFTEYPWIIPIGFVEILAFYIRGTCWFLSKCYLFCVAKLLMLTLFCFIILSLFLFSVFGSKKFRYVLDICDWIICLEFTPDMILLWLKLVVIYLAMKFEFVDSIVYTFLSISTLDRVMKFLDAEYVFLRLGKIFL